MHHCRRQLGLHNHFLQNHAVIRRNNYNYSTVLKMFVKFSKTEWLCICQSNKWWRVSRCVCVSMVVQIRQIWITTETRFYWSSLIFVLSAIKGCLGEIRQLLVPLKFILQFVLDCTDNNWMKTTTQSNHGNAALSMVLLRFASHIRFHQILSYTTCLHSCLYTFR